MIDPRIVLILAAIYSAVWGVHKVVDGLKKAGHVTKTAITRVVHPHGGNAGK
jgi:hypothetical protein